jgi:uncharacterized protein YdcH (DUF465 family)
MSRNLYDLLQKLQENDNEFELSAEDFAQLNDDLKDKVDGIYEFYSRCEAEIERIDKDYIKPLQARKKAIQNSMDSLENWVIDTMVKNDFPLIHGQLMTIRLQERASIKVDDLELDQAFYLEHKDIVKRKYELDKKAIAENIKNGSVYEFARSVKNKFLKFQVKKGESKK